MATCSKPGMRTPKTKQRVVMCALIYAKREHIYQIDTASFMLTTEHWIPIEGTHEVDLIEALTQQRRRFMKPLRYDARSAASFPNVLLLDTGAKPTPLHVVSASLDPRDRAAKEKALKAPGDTAWVWNTDRKMPPLPEAAPPRTNEESERTPSSDRQSPGGLERGETPKRRRARAALACDVSVGRGAGVSWWSFDRALRSGAGGSRIRRQFAWNASGIRCFAGTLLSR